MEKINFKKGESISIGFLLNAGYDMARIQSCSAWLGGKKFQLATIGQMLRCEIASTETHLLAGKYKLILWLDDSVLGIKKIEVTDVEVSFNHANDNNTSINTGYDFVFTLAINELAITLGDILYDYVKGADGEKGEDGAPAVLPPNIVIDPDYVHTDNNYTDEAVLEVAKITNKVDKVAGKSLIADTEITRLAGVSNYDDTNVLNAIASKEPANANIQAHISATGNPHATKLTDLTNETLPDTTPIDADSVITKVGTAIKASTFSSIYTYIKDKLLAASHTFSQLITFSVGVKTDTLTKLNGSGSYVNEDGGTIWHTTKWFTNSGTFSSNGTTVTTTSGQLTSAMIGAKIGSGTDKRIITAVANSNSCTVASAFSVNYAGVSDWGVWSMYTNVVNGIINFYGSTGRQSPDSVGIIDLWWKKMVCAGAAGTGAQWGIDSGGVFSNNGIYGTSNGFSNGAKDVQLARLSTGLWVVYDGTNTTALRDLKLRSVIVSDNTAVASAAIVGSFRYRPAANGSFCEMVMQTGASTYEWILIKQITW